jgi:hypothetical protein
MRLFHPTVLLCLSLAVPLAGQVRTTQPPVLQIYREIEKPGRFAAHEAVEARWAAHNRQHGLPVNYMALSAVSGPSEVWFVTAYDGLGALGRGTSWGGDNAAYTAGIAKLAAEDGDHLNSVIGMQLEAMPEASAGAYPDVSKMRMVTITTWTVRQGADFGALARMYVTLMKAKGIEPSFRSYRVLGGAPDGTVLVFSSAPSWDAHEATEKANNQAFASLAKADADALGKLYAETVSGQTTRFFNVSPRMSLPPKEWLADPFWKP